MIDDFKKRFYIVLALTVPIMALSPMIQHWLGFDWTITGSDYILLALSTFVFFYGGWPFLQGLATEIKSRSLGRMTLVAVAITVAYVYSVAIVLGLEGMDFSWELATLILIMPLGHWIEMKSIISASKELELLVQLMPSDAHLVHGDHIMDVKTESLKSGDIILVKPGEKIAADGIIKEGRSFLNESMLTGESTADIVLVNSNPKDVSSLILFGKATYRKMIQNLIWATGYNVIALPLAAGIFYNTGIMLNPAIGAVLMSVSTIVVALNARMLKV